MYIDEYISYKIYDQLLPNNSMIQWFEPTDTNGNITGGRPLPNQPAGEYDYLLTYPALHRIKPGVENFYLDHNGNYNFNTLDWHDFQFQERKNIFLNHSFEPIQYAHDTNFWCNKTFDFRDAKGNLSEQLGNFHCNTQSGDRLFLLHSERQSTDIDLIRKNITVQNILPVYWFANGYLCATEWYKQFGLGIFNNFGVRPIKYKFVCANRLFSGSKKYRLEFLNLIDLEHGAYSLLETCPYTGQTPNEVLATNVVKPNSFDHHGNESAYIEMRYQTPFNTSFLHIATETLFTEQKHHLTEKVFKPIVLQQPFVLVAPRGCLRYLKSYGFRTFDNWWDESYDTIKDPDQRLAAIAKIVNNIADMDWEDLYRMRTEMTEVLEHNRKLFYGRFAADCWHELKCNINQYF
jgi:hypothetical protein